jgi:hypothetical protein
MPRKKYSRIAHLSQPKSHFKIADILSACLRLITAGIIMAKENKPNVVSMTPKEAEEFKERINHSSLNQHDQKIVLALLSFNFWLQTQLERTQLTLLRLKKILGLATEKHPK